MKYFQKLGPQKVREYKTHKNMFETIKLKFKRNYFKLLETPLKSHGML